MRITLEVAGATVDVPAVGEAPGMAAAHDHHRLTAPSGQ
jgi:hypothetical protein